MIDFLSNLAAAVGCAVLIFGTLALIWMVEDTNSRVRQIQDTLARMEREDEEEDEEE